MSTEQGPAAAAQGDVVAFLGRVLGDMEATYTSVLVAIGDRLGLFRALAPAPATADELASLTDTSERYVAEWLAALTAAGYVEHDSDTGRYTLPPAHAVAFADEGNPFCVAGMYENFLGLTGVLEQVTDAFRTGEGVRYAEYPPSVFDGMARMSGTALENVLVPKWLPMVPDLVGRLEAGARVADVGCGQGRAVLTMARAFPKSTFVGIDAHRPNVENASARAGALGLGDRVQFQAGDAATGVPGPFDVVCLFDVLHDSADPAALLRSVRSGLAEGGTLLVLEPNTTGGPTGPVASIQYGMSVLYCMSVSLGSGGPGLGTCGTPEPVVRRLCEEAGFASVDEIPIENFMNRMYAVRC
jgi:2-polyprenyl-3-methyl-5-hydroxy-6-metoxy-1,4-benzoquinol methylase